jgi:hypothetical protein
MAMDVSIGYLTGTAKAIRNTLCGDVTEPREGYTLGQMFFKPYESKEEFIYCARHTLIPAALVATSVLVPFLGIFLPCFFLGAAGMFYFIAGVTALFCSSSTASVYCGFAEGTLEVFLELLVDVLVLPIAAVAMLTRGVATGVDFIVDRLVDHEESEHPLQARV